ncbi:hypothetical protein [Rhodococcus sp. 24CO]|uniref:hypothetical protein n=1 Tax=Rhodococcus sp. 24CO TaxID=3117460 RepID=UPI003D343975
MMMRATHLVGGRLAVELAPEVFLIDGNDQVTMGGTLYKAMYRIEEYNGDDTVEVSEEQVAEAPEHSTRFAPVSRTIRAGMMQYQSGTY